jgi:FtsH-binding integral membrane protein
MHAHSTTSPVKERSAGRAYFWMGIGLALLGIVLAVVQYSLQQLIVPWYVPILSTLGALVLLVSLFKRRSIPRILAIGLIGVLAGLQWFFLISIARLPAYAGPAQVGQKLPAFSTALADGRAFTQQDLEDGRRSVLVFFRGRW